MSAHTLPATCRCLWCPRTSNSTAEASTHMHVAHPGNLPRSQAQEAVAHLQHLHADRMAVHRGGVVADESLNTPRGAGRALAERLHGIPPAAFLVELDDILAHVREAMLAAGRQAPVALLICREIRQAARKQHAWLSQREVIANGQ